MNIMKELKNIKKERQANLIKAALFIKGESQKNTPVKTGNLKDSAYTDPLDKSAVEIGYTAEYASIVHEIHSSKKKFLEKAFIENESKILKIIGEK